MTRADGGRPTYLTTHVFLTTDSHYPLLTTQLTACQAAVEWKLEEGTYRDDITAVVVYLKDLLPIL